MLELGSSGKILKGSVAHNIDGLVCSHPQFGTRIVEFDNGSNQYAMGIGGNKKVKEGIKCAKNGEWEKGIKIWKNVLNTEPENSAAFYNLGIAYENIGDLENLKTAQNMYKKAVKYGDKKIYLDALYRVKATISDFPKESHIR